MTLVDEFGAIESMLLYSLVCTAVICERNDTELFHVTCQVTNQRECMKRGESSSVHEELSPPSCFRSPLSENYVTITLVAALQL